MNSIDAQPDGSPGLSLPLLIALGCAVAITGMGFGLDRRLRQPIPPTRQDPAWPQFPAPALAPPPDGGRGRVIQARCQATATEFLLYQPRLYNPQRSYPLVVWASGLPPDGLSANDLARRWGEHADRDRYIVLMPSPRVGARLAEVIKHVRDCWHIDPGPVLLEFREFRGHHTKLAGGQHELSMVSPKLFVTVGGPDEVPAVLADESLWPTLVKIQVVGRFRDRWPMDVALCPVVAARAGKIESYRWDLRTFNLPPSRMRYYYLKIHQAGSYPVAVTVRTAAGRTLTGSRVLVAP